MVSISVAAKTPIYPKSAIHADMLSFNVLNIDINVRPWAL
jgi:hypothetical protein